MQGGWVRGGMRVLLPAAAVAAVAMLSYLPVRWNAADERHAVTEAPGTCPAGYSLQDPVEVSRRLNPAFADAHAAEIRRQFGTHFCFAKDFAPAQQERDGATRADLPYTNLSEADLRRALDAKAQLTAQQSSTPLANGHWETYAKTVLVNGTSASSGYDSQSGNGGIPFNSARVDSFSWDAANKRLFASGPGGVWMTQALNGDVSTLATQASPWTSVGDHLPIQLVSQVAWTPAGGGRLIALTGEQTIGGGIMYTGLGAYWSADLGQTWTHASGVPDGAMAFRVAVDESNPNIVYAATSKGLFRSTDAGASFVNVNLPVSPDCAGSWAGKCQFANVVTDVVVKKPGGMSVAGASTPLATVCGANGCPVLAAVGYYRGGLPYADGLGTPRAPGNGLYRSDSGQQGTFARVGDLVPPGSVPPTVTNQSGVTPAGFASQERIGRIQLGAAIGDSQDHNYIFANVQDAILINGGGFTGIDIDVGVDEPANPVTAACKSLPANADPTGLAATTCSLAALASVRATYFNGIYVSPDFGSTWVRLLGTGDLTALAPASGSTLGVLQALGYGPGIQSWYNNWIKPDPTQGIGAPVRFGFGLEEVWQYAPVSATNTTASPQFKVIGTYLAGSYCAGLSLGGITSIAGLPPPPGCPIRDGFGNDTTTTHPDQHDGIFIPDGSGGVWLFVGNDGGVNKQYSANLATDPFSNTKWGQGDAYNANWGMLTLMPWGVSVAADGTVYSGHQDNAMGRIDPVTREWDAIGGGDGGVTAVDPNNSNTAYFGGGDGGNFRTFDGGKTRNGDVVGGQGGVTFVPAFKLDPTDANHMVGANTSVGESLDIAAPTQHSSTVFDLGTDPATGAAHAAGVHALDVLGAAAYVGFCGPCSVPVPPAPGKTFQRGLATNVGGPLPPQKGTSIGWHFASAAGLPNRYIFVTYIDPQVTSAKTVYVGLASNYNTARWSEAGQYLDANPAIGSGHLFVSTDAGETFSNISGNLPDVEISAIARRGNQLIVGTPIGVFISGDMSGSSWAPLGDGPGASTAIQNLILQPGNPDHLFAGTYGRGVQLYDFSAIAPSCTAPTIEDDDKAIVYTPGWHLVQNASASAGHFRLNAGGDSVHTASLSFSVPSGTQGAITYFFARSPQGGSAKLYLDNVATSVSANFRGGTSQNTLKSPAFGVSVPLANIAAGTHTLKIVPNGDGAAYVDGFCLANASKGAAAGSGPGPTSSSTSTLAPGQSTIATLTLPSNTTTLSVLSQSSGGSSKTLILDPLGTVVGTLNAVSTITTVDLPSPALGLYSIQTLNTGTAPVDVWTLATPQVQR